MVQLARSKLTKIVQMVEEASSSSPIEKQFISDLMFSIEKTDSSTEHTSSKAFKPSSIGQCPRSIYFQLIGAKPDSDRRSSAVLVGILENGTDRHIRIQKAIEDMRANGVDCDYIDVETFINNRGLQDEITVVSKVGMETKCYSPIYNVSFLTDGIICYKGKYYILEIKTMNAQKFVESRAVREEHRAQGILYCILFHLDKIMYLYEDRNGLQKKAFILEVSDEMKQELLDKMKYITDCVEQGVVPEIPENKKCTYCAYMELCQNAQNN